MRPFLIAMAAGLTFAVSIASAQTTLDGDAVQPSPDDCVADVAPEGEESLDADPEAPVNPDDTAMLERCGSVLAPPPTGDQGLIEPPPATGETPVVTPEMLPEQQPVQP